MKEKVIYECEFCGYKDERKDFMEFHEKCCALNPENQPCSMCSNMIVGMGCFREMDPELIKGNVKCFFYKEGIPQIPSILFNSSNNENDHSFKDDPTKE